MNKDFYIRSIEKTAGAKEAIIKSIVDNKNSLAMLGAGAGALGGAYLLSDKEDRKKIKDGYKNLREKQKEFNKNHKLAKGLLRSGGALAGTAMALKGGRPLAQAIGDGGIAGTAIGDLVGSTVLPVKDLYSKHKEEFGTSPDAKSVAKVLGANALPSAALWGSLYGFKKGALKNSIANSMSTGVNNSISGAKELAEIFNKYNGKPELISSVGKDVVEKQINDKFVKMWEGGMAVPMAMMTPNVVRKSIASIPGALVTPESIIQKKKEIEDKSK